MKTALFTFLLLFCFTLSKAQLFTNSWGNGKYYTTDGAIIKGLISKNPKGNRPVKGEKYILFKTDSNANKEWIPLTSVKSFVIFDGKPGEKVTLKTDSFTVSRSSYAGDLGYVKVIIDNHYKIYKGSGYSAGGTSMMAGSTMMMTNTSNDVYLFGTEPNNLTEITRGIFMDVMPMVMADKPVIVAAITKKEFRFGDIDELIQYYKTGINPFLKK